MGATNESVSTAKPMRNGPDFVSVLTVTGTLTSPPGGIVPGRGPMEEQHGMDEDALSKRTGRSDGFVNVNSCRRTWP